MSTKTTKLGLPLIPEAEYDTKKVIDMIKENQGTATDSAFNKIDSFASDIDTRVAGKQEQLVSGQNIKTINGKSVLGTGDIEITVPNVPVEDVTVNGSSVVANKTAKITVPTKVSDLANDSKFITNSVDNLVNYYNKADVYTKTEIDNTLATFSKLKLTVVESLPSTGSSDTIYLVPAEQTVEQNYYNEYIWLSNKWELLGNTKIDLSDYYKKSEVDNKFATKTDVQAVDAKIPSLDGYATETYVNNHHDNTKVDKTDFKFKTVNNQEITGEGNISITVPDVPVEGVTVDGVSVVDNKIAKISLSGKQDVISDLADIRAGATLGKTALQAVPDEYAKKTDIPEVPTMVSAFTNDAGYLTEHQDISGKADKTYVDTELTKKQATLVSGTNIKTINNQSILGNGNITIEAAEQVQADWNETDESSKAYIKNKPTVPSGQIQADWNQADTAATDFIKNKPEIPDAVSVSKTGSATEEVQYITIGENEYKLPSGGSGGSVAFADITGEAIDNESLADALNGKQDLLPDAIGNNGKVLTVEDDQITWAPASGLPGYTDADVGKVLSIITSESEKVSPGVPLKLKDHYSKEELADFVQQYSLSEEVEVEVGVRGAASGQSFQLNVKSDNRGHYSVNYDYYSDLGRIECVYLFADELLAEWPEDG